MKNYYGQDVMGSAVVLFNRDGRVDQRMHYDSWGKETSGNLHEMDSAGYNGKRLDMMTGMYNYGFRDYLPEAQRWMTVDPIRDGTNWYAYVGNDPINFIDPLGLSAASPENDGDVVDNDLQSPMKNFTGTVVSGNFLTVSIVSKYSYFAGEATEYASGSIVDNYSIITHSIGAESNMGVEVGKTDSVNNDATQTDILGNSITSELSFSYAGIGGSFGSNSESPSIEGSISLGYSVLPVSPSIEFNSTRVSTYDYDAAVRSLHTQEELDGWIITE